MQQQKRENSVILKDLTKVKKRIDTEKAELRKKLAKLEADQAAQQSEKPDKAFSIDAIFNSTRSSEENARLIANIKAALGLPYYADSEYRRLSIEYMEAVTDTEAVNLESNAKEIETAVNTIEEAKEHLEQLRKNREDIAAAAAELISNVGLYEVSADFMDYSPAYILTKYKKLCEKYN